MLCKANPLTVVILLLVAFATQLSASSVLLNKVHSSYFTPAFSTPFIDSKVGEMLTLEHSQNKACEGHISDLCEEQMSCEECEVCSVQCSSFNSCVHSACALIANSISFVNFPVIPQGLLSRIARKDRPPIYF